MREFGRYSGTSVSEFNKSFGLIIVILLFDNNENENENENEDNDMMIIIDDSSSKVVS